MVGFPLPSFGSFLECHLFSEACPDPSFADCSQPLLPPPQNSTVLIFLHIPCHRGTRSVCFLLTLLIIQYLFSPIEKMLHEGRTFSLLFPAVPQHLEQCLVHLPSNPTSICVSGCPPPANSCLSFLGDFLQCLGRLFRLEVLRINTHQGQPQPVGPGV